MKNLYLLLLSVLLISLYSGCSGRSLQTLADEHFNDNSTPKQEKKIVNPSQNSALNSVSPSNKGNNSDGMLQKNTDAFIEEDWTPTIEKNSSIKAINDDKQRPFKLQEYVDKAEIYIDAQKDDGKPSHKEEMDKLPVIGTKKER